MQVFLLILRTDESAIVGVGKIVVNEHLIFPDLRNGLEF